MCRNAACGERPNRDRGVGCSTTNGLQDAWSGCMVGVHGHTTGRRAPRVPAPTASAECGLRRGVQLSLSRAGSDQAPHRIHQRRVCTRAAVGRALCGRGLVPAIWVRNLPQIWVRNLRSGGRCRCTRRSRSARRPTCGCRSRTSRCEGSAASCALASWAAARAFQTGCRSARRG